MIYKIHKLAGCAIFSCSAAIPTILYHDWLFALVGLIGFGCGLLVGKIDEFETMEKLLPPKPKEPSHE